ncbi:MAG: hypothetical protein OEV66_01495 [Spirochaetia bacterium]|nr:hypothetical protein [Spirochaetia bacterium]
MQKPEKIIDNLYEKLEEIRKDKGLSKAEFCRPLGKSRNWYQQSLQTKRDIGYVDLARLIEYYTGKELNL